MLCTKIYENKGEPYGMELVRKIPGVIHITVLVHIIYTIQGDYYFTEMF